MLVFGESIPIALRWLVEPVGDSWLRYLDSITMSPLTQKPTHNSFQFGLLLFVE